MSMGSRLRSCGECGRTHYDGECSVINDLRTRLATAEAEIHELRTENRHLVAIADAAEAELLHPAELSEVEGVFIQHRDYGHRGPSGDQGLNCRVCFALQRFLFMQAALRQALERSEG